MGNEICNLGYKHQVEEEKRNKRKREVGWWLLDHQRDSIRDIAKEFMISKSQIHADLHDLKYIDDDLYVRCMKVLKRHQDPKYILSKRRT